MTEQLTYRPRSATLEMDVPVYWGRTWPTTSLRAGEVVTAAFDSDGNLVTVTRGRGREFDGAAELDALVDHHLRTEWRIGTVVNVERVVSPGLEPPQWLVQYKGPHGDNRYPTYLGYWPTGSTVALRVRDGLITERIYLMERAPIPRLTSDPAAIEELLKPVEEQPLDTATLTRQRDEALSEVTRLRNQIESVTVRLHELAEEQGWCEDFDDEMEDFGLRRRKRPRRTRVRATVEIEYETDIESETDDAAEKEAATEKNVKNDLENSYRNITVLSMTDVSASVI